MSILQVLVFTPFQQSKPNSRYNIVRQSPTGGKFISEFNLKTVLLLLSAATNQIYLYK